MTRTESGRAVQQLRITTARRASALLTLSLLLTFPTEAQVTARKAALSTAHPVATRAGLRVLQQGGTAADAAVAVAFALAVVHPQAGNLGGGGFLVYYDSETRGVWTLDFRELAPRAAKRDMFAQDAAAARSGARAVGVPATVAGLDALHGRFGSQPWKSLLAPAIALSVEERPEDAELAADIAAVKRDRGIDIATPLVTRALTSTLQRLAEHGARDFYHGELAKKIVEGVRESGGILGFRDLEEYAPAWRAPLKLRYGQYEIYAPPPPSSGGLVIGETLNILGEIDAKSVQTPSTLHLFLEAQRRAAIDRMRYAGDPLGARIPYRDLLSQARAEQWRKSINPERVTATSTLSEPRDLNSTGEHTTHFTIADAQGNVVALTTGLGDLFGSGVFVPSVGFFLNAAMGDFTSGLNALDPLKRPASPMTPTIVLRDGRPFLAIGARGGTSIPTTVLQVFLNVVVSGMPLHGAVAAPRYHHAGTPDEVLYERGLAPMPTIDALNARGHGVAARHPIGDVHAILFENDRLIAVADPRRGGSAGGY
jgi:gamma-glutamyltranspeptidase/glutathione hydrolase